MATLTDTYTDPRRPVAIAQYDYSQASSPSEISFELLDVERSAMPGTLSTGRSVRGRDPLGCWLKLIMIVKCEPDGFRDILVRGREIVILAYRHATPSFEWAYIHITEELLATRVSSSASHFRRAKLKHLEVPSWDTTTLSFSQRTEENGLFSFVSVAGNGGWDHAIAFRKSDGILPSEAIPVRTLLQIEDMMSGTIECEIGQSGNYILCRRYRSSLGVVTFTGSAAVLRETPVFENLGWLKDHFWQGPIPSFTAFDDHSGLIYLLKREKEVEDEVFVFSCA